MEQFTFFARFIVILTVGNREVKSGECFVPTVVTVTFGKIHINININKTWFEFSKLQSILTTL